MDLSEFSQLITIGVGVSAIVAGFYGIQEYRENRIQQRKTSIFALVKEFEDKKELSLAKKCLDSFYAEPKREWANQSPRYYGKENLKHILRDHGAESVSDPGEKEIRESFDALLDFFGKIWYLLDTRLMEDKELDFFTYYLDKAANSPAVQAYVKVYPFPLYDKLVNYARRKSKITRLQGS
jgi:hypothetical protein